MPTRTRPVSGGKPQEAQHHPKRLAHLRFYLYTVEGTLHDERQIFRVVCCHASDARAMIVQRLPEIDNLKVTRGRSVHYIAIGDHLLHQ